MTPTWVSRGLATPLPASPLIVNPEPSMHLTGPAGGTWLSSSGGPELELDAVDFCRTLSGREQGTGLLAEATPF